MGDAADNLWEAEHNRLFNKDLEDEGFELKGIQALFINGKPAETDKAILWIVDDVEEPQWIPRSQILNQEADCLTVTTWLAEKKGLIDLDEQIPF